MTASSDTTAGTSGHFQDEARDYDAILVVAFGGPEHMDEVIPFLENVLHGRNIPRERLAVVGEHYRLFGGRSPLNDQMRALIAALEHELRAHDLDLPVYWGNRNWHPLLPDTLRQMRDDGVKRALAFFTSAYSSYSGCRQYREDIRAALEAVGPDAPEVDRIRMFFNHPGFIEPNIEHVQVALDRLPAEQRQSARLVFSAHSLPVAMAGRSAYVAQLQEAARLVAEGVGVASWDLVYQSRSGPPHQPWLEPDIVDHLHALHETGTQTVVLVPIGFISDHMEVIYDLDTEARQAADDLGLNLIRVPTVGTHPQFVAMIRELIVERVTANPARRALGRLGSVHDVCGVNCCLPR
jgi:ferrochelatase